MRLSAMTNLQCQVCGVQEAWTLKDSNPGPSACEADKQGDCRVGRESDMKCSKK
jgi:hypothetical protein